MSPKTFSTKLILKARVEMKIAKTSLTAHTRYVQKLFETPLPDTSDKIFKPGAASSYWFHTQGLLHMCENSGLQCSDENTVF